MTETMTTSKERARPGRFLTKFFMLTWSQDFFHPLHQCIPNTGKALIKCNQHLGTQVTREGHIMEL